MFASLFDVNDGLLLLPLILLWINKVLKACLGLIRCPTLLQHRGDSSQILYGPKRPAEYQLWH